MSAELEPEKDWRGETVDVLETVGNEGLEFG
jgi:hypothetical protein